MSLYKDLINVTDEISSISETAEQECDPSFVPRLQKQKMVLKYIAEGVKKQQDEINYLERQNLTWKRITFYELIRQADLETIERVKRIAGEQDFDWKCKHHLFTDTEINAAMDVLVKKEKIDENLE